MPSTSSLSGIPTAFGGVSLGEHYESTTARKYREVTLTVAGRKTGRKISFLSGSWSKGEQLYLFPVRRSETQWYRNILQNPTMQIGVPAEQAEFRAVPGRQPLSAELLRAKRYPRYRPHHGGRPPGPRSRGVCAPGVPLPVLRHLSRRAMRRMVCRLNVLSVLNLLNARFEQLQ